MSKDDSELAEDHDFYPENQDRAQSTAQAAADRHSKRLATFRPTDEMVQRMNDWIGVFGSDMRSDDRTSRALADVIVRSPWVRVVEAALEVRDRIDFHYGDSVALDEMADALEAAGL